MGSGTEVTIDVPLHHLTTGGITRTRAATRWSTVISWRGGRARRGA